MIPPHSSGNGQAETSECLAPGWARCARCDTPQPVLVPTACAGASAIDGTYVCNNGRDCSLRVLRKLRNSMNCLHARTERGKDAPRVWGSWRTQVCLDCGAFRMHAHDEDPNVPPGWSKSAWRAASAYEEATAKSEDD